MFIQNDSIEAAISSFSGNKEEVKSFVATILASRPSFDHLIKLHAKVSPKYPEIAATVYHFSINQILKNSDSLYENLASQLTVNQAAQAQLRTMQYANDFADIKSCLILGHDLKLQAEPLIRLMKQHSDSLKILASIPAEKRARSIEIGTVNYTKGADPRVIKIISLLPEASIDRWVISSAVKIVGAEDAIEEIDPSERIDVIKRTMPFLMGVDKEDKDIPFLIRQIGKIPAPVRYEILEIGATAMAGKMIDCKGRGLVLSAISALPASYRTEEVIEGIVRSCDIHEEILKKYQHNPEGLAEFYTTISPIFENAAHTAHLFTQVIDGRNAGIDDLKEIIPLVIPHFRNITSGILRANYLWLIHFIPKDKRTKELIDEIFKTITDFDKWDTQTIINDAAGLLWMRNRIPDGKRTQEMLNDILIIAPYLKIKEMAAILDKIATTSGWERFLALAKQYMDKTARIAEILTYFEREPLNDELIELLCHFLSVINETGFFLEMVRTIPTDQRLSFLKEIKNARNPNSSIKVLLLLPKTTQNLILEVFQNPNVKMEEILKRSKPQERLAIFKEVISVPSQIEQIAKSIPENATFEQIRAIISLVGVMPAVEEVYSQISLFVVKTPPNLRSYLIDMIIETPPAQRFAFLKALKSDVDTLVVLSQTVQLLPLFHLEIVKALFQLYSTSDINLRSTIYQCILSVHPQDRFTSCMIYYNSKQAGILPARGLLTYLYLNDQGIKLRSRQYLLEAINSITDIPLAAHHAYQVANNPGRYLITSDRDPLLIRAIEVASLTDPSTLADPKNPYQLYMKLKELQAAPVVYSPPKEEVCGESVSFNLAGCRSLAKKCALHPRIKDLPPDVRPNTLRVLFQKIEDHLQTLQGDERKKFNDAIQMGASYQALKRTFLEGDIAEWMQVHGAPDEPVPLETALFYAIVHSLLTESTVRSARDKLTQQEETLLMRATFFQSCSGGKREAIARTYYTQLPEHHRIYKVQEGESLELQEGENLIHREIQKMLIPLFSEDNDFMREITGMNPVVQLPHHAIYLKNRIGELLGLEHTLQFDQSTEQLSDHLFTQDTSALLSVAYRYYHPGALVKNVERAVTQKYRDLLEKDAHNLAQWQQDTSPEKPKKPPEPQGLVFYNNMNRLTDHPSWELDDEYEIKGCTEKGALAFLKGAGILLQSFKRSSME